MRVTAIAKLTITLLPFYIRFLEVFVLNQIIIDALAPSFNDAALSLLNDLRLDLFLALDAAVDQNDDQEDDEDETATADVKPEQVGFLCFCANKHAIVSQVQTQTTELLRWQISD